MTVCCTREAFPLFCASCLVIKISIHIEYRRLYSSCNGVSLHIVFVLLFSVCRSVNVLSCVDVIQFFYVRFTSYYIGRHKKTAGERERKREAIPAACRTVHKRRIKQEYLAVARLLLPTADLLLLSTIYSPITGKLQRHLAREKRMKAITNKRNRQTVKQKLVNHHNVCF